MADSARDILATIRFQETGADQVVASIDQIGEALNRQQTQNQQLAQTFGDLSGATEEQIRQVDDLANSFRDSELQREVDGMVALAQAEQDAADKAAALKAEWDSINAGESPLRRGLSPDPNGGGDDGGGDDGGDFSIGNPLAVGRGARAAGGLARMLGAGELAAPLTGGADILFVARGLQELSGVFDTLNTSIEKTPGLVGGIATALDGLGVPMAGLLTVAIPVTAAIAGIVIAINSLVDTIKKGTDGINADIDQIKKQASLSAGGNTVDLTEQRDRAEEQASGIADAITRTQNELDKVRADFYSQGDLVAKAADLTAIKALQDKLNDLHKEADDNTASINNFNEALSSTQVKANDLSIAVRAAAEGFVAAQQRDEQYDKLNNQQINDKVFALQNEIDARKGAIEMLEANNDAIGTSKTQIDENNKVIAQYNDQIKKDTDDINHLTYISRDLADARDREAEATKNVETAVKALEEEDKIRAQQDQETANFQKQIADAQEKTNNQIEDSVARFNTDLEKLQTDAGRKEADIAQQSADKIVDIRTKEGEQEQAAFQKYTDQLADDQTKYHDAQAKLQQQAQNQTQVDFFNEQVKMRDLVLNAQQQQARDELTHEQNLASIRQQAQQDEEQALLDGNFERLYQDQQAEKDKEANENTRYDNQTAQLQLQLSQQEQQEAQHYADQQQLQQLHLQQQQQALDTALTQEEAAQLTAYDRKLRDLKINEDNQIAQQNEAEARKERDLQTWADRQLQDLQTAETERETQIQVNLGRELVQYQENYNARMQLLQKEFEQVQSMIAGASGGSSGNYIAPYATGSTPVPAYADGGSFAAGAPGFGMSEDVDETLKIAGKSYRVGGGAAWVIPLQSGNVESDKGRQTPSGPIQIILQAVNDPQANAREIASILNEWTGVPQT